MPDEKYIRPEAACRMLQVVPGTLRSWANQGKLEFVTTKGGHRRYSYNSVLSQASQVGQAERSEQEQNPDKIRRKICYARVSSYTQKKDLDTQLEFFQSKFPEHTCIKDLGSGLNFKRKGFLSILDGALKGTIEEVVVTHKDRLCRFGFEIIERVLQKHNGRIVVLNSDDLSPEQEPV